MVERAWRNQQRQACRLLKVRDFFFSKNEQISVLKMGRCACSVQNQGIVVVEAAVQALTDAEHDDENDEGVHHGEDGGGDGGDHLSQLLDAPEEPDDPQRPHEANEP